MLVMRKAKTMKCLFMTLFFIAGIGYSSAADEWTMFKSDIAHSSVAYSDSLATPFVLKWTDSVTPLGSTNAVAYSSPVVLNGKTYIGCIDGNLYAFNASSGALIWKNKTDGYIYGSPAVATIGGQDYVFVGSTDGNLYGFNSSTQALVCKQALGGPIFTSPIIINESSVTLLVCASHSGTLAAFNINNPSSTTTSWSDNLSSNYFFASPAYDSFNPANDLIYEPSYDGNLYAVHASGSQAGQVAWSANVGPTRSTPAVSPSFVYNLSNNGTLSCFLKTQPTLKASISIGGPAAASPSVYNIGGNIDVIMTAGLNGTVQQWSLPSSTPAFSSVWSKNLPNAIYSSPAICNPLTPTAMILVGCNDKNLYALNFSTGAILSTTSMGKSVQVSPAVAEGNLFISSGAGNFQAYAVPTATPSPTPTPPAVSWTQPANTLTGPRGVAIDYLRTVGYVADGNSIKTFNLSTGSLLGTVGAVGQFGSPQGIAMGNDGYLYVANYSAGTWQKVDPGSGNILATIGASDSLGTVRGIWIDVNGDVYLTSTGFTNTLVRYVYNPPASCGAAPTYTKVTLTLGGTALNTPTGIAKVGSLLFVADSVNNRTVMYKETTTGSNNYDQATVLSTGSVGFSVPQELTADLAGNVYVTSYNNSTYMVYGPTGSLLSTNQNSAFGNPFGIGVDTAGSVYLSNNGSLQLLKVTGGSLTEPAYLTPTPTSTCPPSTSTPTLSPTSTPAFLSSLWGQATPAAAFSARSGQASVYYNNLLWVIGGQDSGGLKNDVWYSPDGVDWQSATSTAAFTPRVGHQVVVYNNQMWLLGGYDGTNYKNDVWTSTDGAHWSPVSGGPFFTPRANFGAVVYNGQMWVIGGVTTNYVFDSDVWNSTTGSSWNNPTVTQGYGQLASFGCVVFNNQMWILGGNVGLGPSSSIFSSTNGTVWNHQTTVGFPALMNESAAVYNDQIYAFAGVMNANGITSNTSNVYTSPDGIIWNLSNNSPGFTPRSSQSAAVAFNAIWMMGGSDSSGNRNDVWYSPFNPTPTSTASPITPTVTLTPTSTLAMLSASCPSNNTWTVANPMGVALDGLGNVYVTDDTLDEVDAFNSTGTLLGQWGIQGPGNGQFNEPEGIAVDNHGNVYVADSGNNRVQIFNTSGNYLGQWGQVGSGLGQFQYPSGIAVNPAGTNIFVSDSDNGRVQVFNPQGTALAQFGNGVLNQPWGIAVDSIGRIYVADFGNSTVDVFNPQYQLQAQWAIPQTSNLQAAEFVAVGGNGVVYVSDSFGSVGMFDTYGNWLGSNTGWNFVQNGVWMNTPFNETEGLASSPDGSTWLVADWVNGAIYEFGSCSLTPLPTATYATLTPTSTPTPSVTSTNTYTPVAPPLSATPYTAFIDSSSNGWVEFLSAANSWVTVANASYGSGNYPTLTYANNLIYAAYSDFGGNVWLKTSGGVGWSTVGPTSAGSGIGNVSLALSGTTPYVAYLDGSGNGWVADYNGSTWAAVGGGSFGPQLSGLNPSLAVSGTTPYVVSVDTSKNGWVRTLSGTTWSTVGSVPFGGNNSSSPSLLLASGTPYVAFTDANNNGWVASSHGSVWVTMGGNTAPFGQVYTAINYPSLPMSSLTVSNGMFYVAYVDPSNNGWVKAFNGTSWMALGNVPFAKGVYATGTLAFSGGTACVAYVDGNGNQFVAAFDGTVWQVLGDSPQGINEGTDEARDGADPPLAMGGALVTATITSTSTPTPTFTNTVTPTATPSSPWVSYVAFEDTSKKGWVMENNGGTWSTLGNSSYGTALSTTNSPSFATSNGTAYVAYVDGSSKGWLEQSNGSGWTAVGNSSFGTVNVNANPSVALLNGIPYVAFEDSNGKGWVAAYNGSAWTMVGNGSYGNESDGGPSLVASNGALYVLFSAVVNSAYNAYVMEFNGNSWAPIGGTAAIGIYMLGNLAVSNGTPYFAYLDNSGKAWVTNYNSGSGWGILGSGPAYTTGYFIGPMLTLSNGNPYLAFIDGNDKGWVEYYNGTTWSTVGSAPFGTNFNTNSRPSLSVINGTSYVAYDILNGPGYDGWLVSSNGGAWTPIGGSDYVTTNEEGNSSPSLQVANGLIVPTSTPTSLPLVWGQADPNGPFSGRQGQASLYYNNQFWIIGGQDSTGPKNDVWYSSDGTNWKLTTGNAAFSARYGHQVIAYNGMMWLMGGYDGTNYLSDVWTSTDGVNWTQSSYSLSAARAFFRAVTFNGAMWVIGGQNFWGLIGEVDSSTGNSWTSATSNAAFWPRENFGCTVFKNQIWVLGGTTGLGGVNDVWSSSDGANWNFQGSLPIGGVGWANAWVYANQIYALGYNGTADGLCVSADGINWALAQTPNFSTRSGSSVLAAGTGMWVIAGQKPSASPAVYDNDVWVWPASLITPTITPTFIPTNTPTGTASPTLSPTPTSSNVSAVWRVNCGGGSYTDSNGNFWSADENYSGPNVFTTNVGDSIQNTSDQTLYQSDRLAGNPTALTYTFSVPPGQYNVTLKFAETYWGLPGKRVFNVFINNNPVIWNFDILYDAGGKDIAYDKTFSNLTPNQNNQFVIQFQTGLLDNPKINAIQIVPVPATSTPTPTLTITPTAIPAMSWYETTNSAPFGSRSGAAAIGFNNQLWVIGGNNGTTNLDDVWSSPDGVNWTLDTSNPGFSARSGAGVLVYNNLLWILGGNTNSGAVNDVWNSPDGTNWNHVTTTQTFSTNPITGAFVDNNFLRPLCLVAGNTLWYGTPDGTFWSHGTIIPSTPLQSVFYGNQIWALQGPCADWASPDGVFWTSESVNSSCSWQVIFNPNSPSQYAQQWTETYPGMSAAVYNGAFYLLGGSINASFTIPGCGSQWGIPCSGGNGGPDSQIMSSPDGLYWTSSTAPFTPRTGQAEVSALGKLWVIGGSSSSDVWYAPANPPLAVVTPDPTPTPTFALCSGLPGATWTPVATTVPTNLGNSPNGLVFDPLDGFGPRMWVINTSGTVYSSFDSVNWTQVGTIPISPQSMSGQQAVVFNGQIWVIGGVYAYMGPGGTTAQVWHSSNGANWTMATANANFGRRYNFGLLAYNNKLWIFGGNPYLTYGDPWDNVALNDVWNSTDGINWTEVSPGAPFAGRWGPTCMVFNNEMWVVAGYSVNGWKGSGNLNDAWSSTDGVNWTEATSNANFPARSGALGTVCGNSMWLANGTGASGFLKDAWVTTDGANWTLSNGSTPFSMSTSTNPGVLLSYNGSVWAILTTGSAGNPWTWNAGCCLQATPTPSAPTATPTPYQPLFCPLAQWGGYGTGNGQFNQNTATDANDTGDLAVDWGRGFVYVSDSANNRIQKFNLNGGWLATLGSGGTGVGLFSNPSGVAVDSNGNLYVADYGNNRVQVLKAGVWSSFGSNGSGNGSFLGPVGIAVDAGGNIYVTDSGNHRVQVFNSSYVLQGSPWTGFTYPMGIALDGSGNAYVADYGGTNFPGTDQVQKWTTGGTHSFNWGTQGTGNKQFEHPYGVAVGPCGNVFVSDTINENIQEFDTSGNYLGQLGAVNNTASVFNQIGGFAFDGSNNLYTVESISDRIQKFSPCGLNSCPLTPAPTPTSTPNGLLATASGTVGSSALVLILSDGSSVQVPAGVLQSGSIVTINEFSPSVAPALGAFQVLAGNVYTFSALSPAGGTITNFGTNQVTLVFPIPSGSNSSLLQVSYYNGTAWTTVPATVDTVHDTATALVNHFSTWGVILCQSTPTPTSTATNTSTNTATSTATSTSTSTFTATATNTATATPTNTPTLTATNTSTPSATSTATNTATNTVTNTATYTATPTATNSTTNTATVTTTNTGTKTATPTATSTATSTATKTPTQTATKTATNTPTKTGTPTNTATKTATPTNTPCGVAFATATATSLTATSATFSYTVSGTNTLLLVQVYIEANGTSDVVNTVTFNGTALTRIVQDRDTTSGHGDLETWRLVNPASGTHNVVVSISDTTARVLHIGAISYTGVNQTSPIGASTSLNQAAATSHSISLTTTTANSLVVGMCTSYGTGVGITPGTGQVQKWVKTDNNETEGDDKAAPTAGSTSLSYTLASSQSADMEVVEIKAVNTSCAPVPAEMPFSSGEGATDRTQTPTTTPTISPTPSTPGLEVVAAPNVSRDGQPIQFRVRLDEPAKIEVFLFNLTGEQVFEAESQGNAGLNTITWNLENLDNSQVASGLYIYVLKAEDGGSIKIQRGKVAVLH